MRARTFLLILLALVLWGREAQGRGSTETWVEAMGTTLSCTLDVVLPSRIRRTSGTQTSWTTTCTTCPTSTPNMGHRGPSQDRGGLQQATYEEAKAALKALKPGLKLMNQSVLKSLEEGLEEPDAPSPGTSADTEGSLPQHQLHRERQQSPGPTHTQRTALDELLAASPLGSHGAARHRIPSAQGHGLSSLTDAPASFATELGIKQLAMTG